MEVYKVTHERKDGTTSSQAAAKAMEDMDKLSKQNPQSSESTGVSRNDIYGQVMGPERHGRVRTFGLGPTPTTVFCTSFRQSNTRMSDSETQPHQDVERMQLQMEAEIQRVRGEMNIQMQENEFALRAEIEVMKAKDNATRTEIEAMKAKENATRAELEIMQAQMRDLMAQLRPSGLSNQSPQDVSSATG